MSITPDPRQLFTKRHASYARFIRAVRYHQGLRSYFIQSPLLRPGVRVLDAGCGTGALTLAVYDAAVCRGAALGALDGFDLTPAMLEQLEATLERRRIDRVQLAEANVLSLGTLPPSWCDYDVVVSASMLEYVPRERFVEALRALRARLKDGGRFVLFITRRNPLTRIMIARWWASNIYTAPELADAFKGAGFARCDFPGFPLSACYLSTWGYVVEAER